MKDGSFTVTAKTGTAMSNLGAVERLRDGIKDKGVTFTVTTHYRVTGSGAAQMAYSRTGGGHQFAGNAAGGLVRGYASGGDVQYFPGGGFVSGPGGPRSDSILAMFASGARARVSNTEYVVQSSAVRRYGVPFLDALNSGRLSPLLLKMMAAGRAGGGVTGAGQDVARGLVHGMTGSTGQVEAGARLMAAGVVTGIKDELEIASPSKKTKALAKDVGRGFIAGLTGTRAKIKSVSADLVKDIKTAFSGKKETTLVKMVDQQTRKLLELAAKRDKLAAKILEAKQYAKDVTRTARDQSSLSSLGMQPEEVTASGIKAGLAAKLAKIKQFSKYIDILAKKGLNKSLLRQILNMGPEDGYAYASALVGADKRTFKQINSMQSQLNKSTDKLGKRGADILYDSGKNAAKGFLTGLKSQQKDIEKLMVSIAQAMQKSIKKALGIKSPSTVMARLGRFSTQGLARGLVGALPEVDRALGVVTGRVASAQPVLGRPAVVAGGGGAVMQVQVDINGAMDPVAVGQEVRRVLLMLKRTQGLNVSLGVA
ncbi:hypothetical protein [Streptomyces sp. NPDC087317]